MKKSPSLAALLAVLISLLPRLFAGEAGSYAQALASPALPNDCFVKSVAFLHGYLEANPKECGELLVTPEGGAGGHAVAVFSERGRVWVYDHELGIFETTIRPRDYSARQHRDYRSGLYQERIGWAQADVRAGRRAARNIPVQSELEQARAAGRLLGAGLRVTILRLGGGKNYATLLGFDGALWVYVPSLGTGRVALDGKSSVAQLVRTALGSMGVACDQVEVVD